MSVYVDNYRARISTRIGKMLMCHMVADTVDELHQMAEKLGMKREWFQEPSKGSSCPHYDISLSKRGKAIKLGAILVDSRGLVEIIRRARSAGWP